MLSVSDISVVSAGFCPIFLGPGTQDFIYPPVLLILHTAYPQPHSAQALTEKLPAFAQQMLLLSLL